VIKISAKIASNILHRPGMSVDLDMCADARAGFDCRLCKDACAQGIAGPEDGSNSLDRSNEYCTRCGACASECPTGAIELPEDMYYQKLLGLSTRLQSIVGDQCLGKSDHVAVSCADPMDDGNRGIFGACISWLDQAAILHLLSVAGTNVSITAGTCGEGAYPASKSCTDRMIRYVESVNDLMALIGVDRRAILSSAATSEGRLQNGYGDTVDRNTAIQEVLRQGLAVLAGSRNPKAEPGAPDSTRPQGSGRRLIATRAVQRLMKERVEVAASPTPDDGGSPTGALSRKGPRVDKDICAACGVCTRLCPTGALKTREAENGGLPEWRLSFDVLRCVGCAVCVSVCLTPGAIELTDRGLSGIWRQKGIILARRYSLKCDDCGETYPANRTTEDPQCQSHRCISCKLRGSKLSSFY